MNNVLKSTKGITLIALVITIIVLLILAGVSIAMLTGENGILTQAQNAKKETSIAEEKELIALAYNAVKAEEKGGAVTAGKLDKELEKDGADATEDGENIKVTFRESKREYIIDENGNITEPTESNIVATIKIEGEKLEGEPPMPAGFTHVAGTTVDNGYVIQDGDENQYVWIPVDKNQKIKVNVTSKEDITSITLTDPYGDTILTESNKGTTYTNNEIEPTINGPYILNVKTATEEKTTILGVHSLYAQDTTTDWQATDEYAKIKGYDTFEEFYIAKGYKTEEEFLIKSSSIKDYSDTEDYEESVNQNGGFYIGRYEASENNGVTETKENKKPRSSILQTEALAKANDMYDSQEFTSSLLTGSAWDRTLGWLEETGAVTSFEIVGDSKTWGNYFDDTFSGTTGLINTGSKSETEKNHIFDLAGNVREWTTEADSSRRVLRGGIYYNTGSNFPCSYRSVSRPGTTDSDFGFRLTLYL